MSVGVSVHWEDWPFDSAQGKPTIDVKLEEEMSRLREYVTLALGERAKAQLKVRQPLSLLKIKGNGKEIRKDLLVLLKDEVNVKEVAFEKNLKNDVELDTVLTPALKEEGYVREILRSIQEMRKEAGCKPGDSIQAWYDGSVGVQRLFTDYGDMIKKAAGIRVLARGKVTTDAGATKEIGVDGDTIIVSIKV